MVYARDLRPLALIGVSVRVRPRAHMKPIFIGLAGGTGAGKSTLAFTLKEIHPDKIGVIQLDDYFKPKQTVPEHAGLTNWDHPESINFDKIAADLALLAQGKPAVIDTKNAKLNPDFERTQKRIPVEFAPKPIMLIEGYLALHDERIRKFFTTSIWLEVDHATRWNRRVHFKNSEYEEKVLIPMHKQFVEPTKKYAQHVIDVSRLTAKQVFEKVDSIIKDL